MLEIIINTLIIILKLSDKDNQNKELLRTYIYYKKRTLDVQKGYEHIAKKKKKKTLIVFLFNNEIVLFILMDICLVLNHVNSLCIVYYIVPLIYFSS